MLESRLRDLGIELPAAPKPLGRYVPAAQVGDLLFLSGMLPLRDGKLSLRGRIGSDLSIEQGRQAAALAAQNALAVAGNHLGGLDRIHRVVRVGVTIISTADFEHHAAVADGASDLFVGLFGESPGHTRLAAAAHSLPMGAPLVLEVIFAVRPTTRE